MNIVMMGVQGSGKGTQSKSLSRELDIPHISVGDLFRENVGKGTNLGKRAKEFMDKGELVPDSIVINMIKDRLEHPDVKAGCILDGFPRNGIQLAALEYLRPVEHAVLLELDKETAIERLTNRIECPKCGIIYGMNMPPKNPGVCDKCGGPLTQRSDDLNVEAVEKRIALYHKEIEVLVRYYDWKGVLRHVNAGLPQKEVFERIKRFII